MTKYVVMKILCEVLQMQVQIYVCGWKETRQQSINCVLPKVKFKKK